MRFAEFLLNSIPILIQFYAQKYAEDDYTKSVYELENEFNVPNLKSHDFVVVGGGTAGCVMAARLSEKYSVLLLEAGGTPPPAAAVPYFFTPIVLDPSINYFFKSVPQTNASLSNGGILSNHVGKMLGGSGSHNDNIHNRGSSHDFDNWAAITNDTSFSYGNVLKYFKKSETFIGLKYGDIGDDGDEYYGKDGPIIVDSSDVPLLPIWFEAGRELGFITADPNALQQPSFTPSSKSIRRGQRSSSYSEYIKPIEMSRPNLTVIRYANVSEILIDNNKVAYGVAYTRHRFPQIAYADKEVILSAGAFASPLLLIKSGVGPVETLQQAEIPVKVPLDAVGKSLGEHASLILSPFYVNDSSLFERIDPTKTEEIVKEYHESGGGILGIFSGGPQCFATSSKAESGWPDISIVINPHVMTGSEPQVLSIFVFLGRPKSKGSVTLDAEKYKAGVRDDVQLANIDFKMLTHPDDVEVMLEGIKLALQIVEDTASFKKLDMTYGADHHPACGAHEFRSDEYWRCVLQQDSLTWNHMAGTCSLGPANGDSNTSVLDPKFRVRGIAGLRVVDGSVMPEVTNSNTNAPILMLAEKAADDVLAFWSRNNKVMAG